jgi:hypothetical protein
LAAIYFSTPKDELERSSTNRDSIPNDEWKDGLDDILDTTPLRWRVSLIMILRNRKRREMKNHHHEN